MKEYYYLDNNKPVGPMSLVELLEIIDRDTMVWREGIKWSLASELDELKKFFPEVVVTSNKQQKIEYYYLENNKSIGPLNLVELLESIDRETMVWREGIDWTVACKLEELQKYFPADIYIPEEVKIPTINKPPELTTPEKTDSPSPAAIPSVNIQNRVNSYKLIVEILDSLVNNKLNSQNCLQITIEKILFDLYENLFELKATTKTCLFISPNVNLKKFTNFKINMDIGENDTDSVCLLYYDDTLFGSGDDGFMLTKNAFSWHNMGMKSNSIKWKEISAFTIGSKKSKMIIKAINDTEYTIEIICLPFADQFVNAFNALLKILK